MIRYVDSAGWTWEVCELADRRAADTAPAGAVTPPPGLRAAPPRVGDAIAVHPGLADAPPADDAPVEPGELYFLSRVGTRKLRDYPATWTSLSRTGLEALCDRARDLEVRIAG